MRRLEGWIALGTPLVAMVTVGVGLELGARGGVRSALVYGAPPSRAYPSGAAWQILASEEAGGLREPLVQSEIALHGEADGKATTWRGTTNVDGVAEAFLGMPRTGFGETWTLEVRSGSALLARGSVIWPDEPVRGKPAVPWAPFARREGPLEIDVVVLGERVAPSFPASVWVRVRDAATHAPVAGVDVAPERDASLASFTEHARTDSRGWAEVAVTPVGLAIAFAVAARGPDGRTGTWTGGLVASPGAARVATRPRWAPDEGVEVAVVAPPARSIAYVEIDDRSGRAWATSITLATAADGSAVGQAQSPALAPGLYWAVAAGDSAGAAGLGPGTSVRPFFVARSDEEALALGPDAEACALPRDVREDARAIDTCLALAVATPVPRWIALDGFAAQKARDAERRGRGLAVALGGVAVAVLLEGVLLLRAAGRSRPASGDLVPVDDRRWTVLVALLTGLLGFALLAAFLLRMS